MKKLFNILLVLLLSISLLSCGIKTPTFKDFEDNYVDKLPEKAEDGLTLHCFNWTYNQIKENLSLIAYAGFKNILTMPVQQPKSYGSAWWAFYQPLSFSIGDNSPLGSKQDLIDLCNEAEKYGICILVDAVVNHMANAGDKAKEEDGTPMVDPAVEEYEPILYRNRNQDLDGSGVTFHHNPKAGGTGSETQVYQYGNLPDLNTANPYVQERVLSFFKECIDAGVDGFRFDAAKHVETGQDKDYASNFWKQTLELAKDYYKQKTGDNLYVYGEILGHPSGRLIDVYTSLMRVTDDGFVASFKNCMAQKNASLILNASLKVNDTKKLIAWVESHDEYISGSTHYSDIRVAKYWSVIAAKQGLGGLYLARPSEALTVGEIGSLAFLSENVAIANRFHNRFYNARTFESATDTIYVNEKIKENDQGALIINVDEVDENKAIEVELPHLEDGNYYDSLTGRKIVVYNNKTKIKFDSNGVCIITRSKSLHPSLYVSDTDSLFIDEKEIELKVNNCEEAYYYFNNDINNKQVFDNSININLNDHLINNEVTLNVYVRNGNNEINRILNYKKLEINKDKFNVLNLDPKYLNGEYELYIWSWSPSKWSKDYEIKDGVLLVDTNGMDGFLLAIFEKGYEVKDIYSWDDKVIKQSFDISGDILKKGFVDMKDF